MVGRAPVRVAILADYNQAHPSIRPKQFSNLIVENGGVGALQGLERRGFVEHVEASLDQLTADGFTWAKRLGTPADLGSRWCVDLKDEALCNTMRNTVRIHGHENCQAR